MTAPRPGGGLERRSDDVLGVGALLLALEVGNGRVSGAGQDGLHLLRGLAGLRRVGFVDEHRVAATHQLRDLVDDEGELLQRGDDDLRLGAGESIGELFGVLVDLGDDAVRVLELEDRVLQLPVEHPTVGDDDHLVEHLLVGDRVQRRQPVGEPRDRVRLAGPGRVLHEVLLAGAVRASVRLHRPDRVPLVETGEDDRAGLLGRLGLLPRRVLLDVDEPGEDIEPRVALPHLLPQVGRCVSIAAGRRVAGAATLTGTAGALVERQEPGGLAVEPGRHHHRVGIDGEVDDCPPQHWIGGVAIGAVLRHGVLDGLARERILQLRRGHRDAVHHQHEVERITGMFQAVMELADDGEAIGGVPGLQVGVQTGARAEVRQPDRDAEVLDAVPQHVDHASAVDLGDEPVLELLLGDVRIAAVQREELVPVVDLRCADEGEQLRPVDPDVRIKERRRHPLVSAVLHEPRLDRILEGRLVVQTRHRTTARRSACADKARTMRVRRFSSRRLSCRPISSIGSSSAARRACTINERLLLVERWKGDPDGFDVGHVDRLVRGTLRQATEKILAHSSKAEQGGTSVATRDRKSM